MKDVLRALREILIDRNGSLAVLTGAGISAESGVATFRGGGGLWEKHRIEDVATPEAYARNPELVLRFYNERRRQLGTVAPNPAHEALARLERTLGERMTLITQNVDDLHERAGSSRVLHMHGELMKARCWECARPLAWTEDIRPTDRCPDCGGALRPHIVWFGEVPFYLGREIPEALNSDVFLAIGTSGSVYPAAGMVFEAKLRRKRTIEVNLEASENSVHFDDHILGEAGTVLPQLVDGILEEAGGRAPTAAIDASTPDDRRHNDSSQCRHS